MNHVKKLEEAGKKIVSDMLNVDSIGPYDFRKVRVAHLPLSSYAVRALRKKGVSSLAGVMHLTQVDLGIPYGSRVGNEVKESLENMGLTLREGVKELPVYFKKADDFAVNLSIKYTVDLEAGRNYSPEFLSRVHISCLNLPVRAERVLTDRLGLRNVSDILGLTKNKLLSTRGSGEKTVEYLEKRLSQIGFQMRQD